MKMNDGFFVCSVDLDNTKCKKIEYIYYSVNEF